MARKIYFEGLEDLDNKLKSNVTLKDVKRVVRHNGQQLQSKIQRKADFTKGYATGTTKRSVDLKIKANGLEADSGPNTEYAQYLELGTRFMTAQKFVGPAYNEQKEKFKSDMKKLTD